VSPLKRLFRLSPLCAGTLCKGCGTYFTSDFDFAVHHCGQWTR
jgi:hypothetical protein